MRSDIVESVRSAAHDFEIAIHHSARSPENDRAKLTLKAVRQTVDVLEKIDGEVGSDVQLCRELRTVFRSELSQLCAMGPLWNRGLMKPRGYAGDFETLYMIYRNQPIAFDAIGRELDRAFLESPLANAVRGRKNLLVSYLVQAIGASTKGNFRLLDLACGPCVDVGEILRNSIPGNRVHFVCVDQDAEAITFSQSLLANGTNNHAVDFLKANVLRLRPCANSPTQEPFDVVYSVGLLDYVPDNLAAIALRNWWRIVAPAGRLVLTIKDRDRFDPTFYDWMADWTFIPRTESDVVRLLQESLGLPDSRAEIFREDTGISIMVVLHRDS